MQSPNKRLFIALDVDPARQPDLVTTWKKLRQGADRKETSVKWSPPENWHVTLKFLGETPLERVPEIVAKLEAAAKRASPFFVPSSGVGAFPDERRARVIWAGVARSQELLDLQTVVEEEFPGIGGTDERDYRPHVTLGRLRSAGTVVDLISPFVRKRFHEIEANALVLYESVQRGAFPIYLPLARASFDASKNLP